MRPQPCPALTAVPPVRLTWARDDELAPTPWPAFELSVVIPCLDEARTIGACVTRARDAMACHGVYGEIVVVDNGSTDGSIEAATAAGARVVSCATRGYGAALQCGIAHAGGRYVLMGDGDESYDFSLLPAFMDEVRRGSAFVIGSRLRGRIDHGAMPFMHRYLGTPVLTWILNFLFGTRISDCNCGMRCFDRELILTLGVSSHGMEFASEMVVKAAVNDVAITEVPIAFHRDQRGRRPHLRSFHDGWRHLRLLLWHAPDHMMTLPGLVMLVLGIPLVLTQLTGPMSVGGAYFDIHYMILGITLSLVGMSSTTLGLVVGSTTPRGRVRHVRFLEPAHRWFTFDNACRIAAALFVIGLISDTYVLGHWLYNDRGQLSAWFTRMTLLGLVLMSMSVQIGLSALLLGLASEGPAASRVART